MKNISINRHHRTVVRLGTHANRFAVSQTGLRILGSIQTGLEIGALAQLPDGTYLQVNGDTHRVLHTASIEAAIARAVRRLAAAPSSAPSPALSTRSSSDIALAPGQTPDQTSGHAPPAEGPVVVYKQRRRISPQTLRRGPTPA
jgi:hypothetical protein